MIIGLLGDYGAALSTAQRGSSNGALSGWTKGQAMAAVNLGYFHVMVGQDDEAVRSLKATPSHFRRQPAYRIAIAETLAQAEFAKSRFMEASNILEGIDEADFPSLRWYDVSFTLRVAKFCLRRDDGWRHESARRLVSHCRKGLGTRMHPPLFCVALSEQRRPRVFP